MLSIVIYRLCGLRIYKTILTYLPQTPPRCPTLPFFEGEQIIDEFHFIPRFEVATTKSWAPPSPFLEVVLRPCSRRNMWKLLEKSCHFT